MENDLPPLQRFLLTGEVATRLNVSRIHVLRMAKLANLRLPIAGAQRLRLYDEVAIEQIKAITHKRRKNDEIHTRRYKTATQKRNVVSSRPLSLPKMRPPRKLPRTLYCR